ncbi:hypothetical protein DH2020_003826 [Rehmannia glutinosa]|uniref:Protein kinase domain-containing protein n=1 Tax=Rehmannia glutinosa TaxID=99300 RepID=A0ABR0XMV7_REHGL
MGCFPCFDSREEEKLNPHKDSDDHKEVHPSIPSNLSKLSSVQFCLMGDRLKTRSNIGPRKEASGLKDLPDGQIAAQIFTFRELANATNNFRPECFLGEGGFGRVYKGMLSNGQPYESVIAVLVTAKVVAVKQLDRNGLQGNREFLVEVLMLSLLHHPNLVNLMGYCADGDQRLLVYEFMPLGSLEDHLHAEKTEMIFTLHIQIDAEDFDNHSLDLPPDKEPLDWNTRMKIAAGAARGLEYLHDKANPPVIYRDFKSSNILLGEGFSPKLSDFGLAKLGPTGDKSHVSTRVMGTYGYCAPEYAMTGQLTVKSDVYSFGVVFLELITGRKAIDSTLPQENKTLSHGKISDRGLYQALAVASMCIQEQAAARPLIGDVVTALSYLANQAYDPSLAPSHSNRTAGDKDDNRSKDERGGRLLRNEEGGGSGRKWDLEGSEREDSPRETAKMLNRDLDRERAVAEAKMWGENWREKRRQNAQGSFDGNNGLHAWLQTGRPNQRLEIMDDSTEYWIPKCDQQFTPQRGITIAKGSKEQMDALAQLIEDHKEKLLSHDANNSSIISKQTIIHNFGGITHILELRLTATQQAKNKGSRNRVKIRLQSQKEKALRASQKLKRRCGKCGDIGNHNSRTCKKLS